MRTIEDYARTSDRYYKSTCIYLSQWVASLAYWRGVERQFALSKQNPKAIDPGPSYSDLQFRYYAGNGTLNLQAVPRHEYVMHPGDPYRFRMLSQSEYRDVLPSVILQTTQYINAYLRAVFDNARYANTIAPCYGCNMHETYGHLGAFYAEPDFPVLSICEEFADKWLCSQCRDAFSMTEYVKVETAAKSGAASERSKMSVSLRFSVLERDGFRCKTCGRSPLAGDSIKLHVDHVYPVSRGGKTEPDNLHTLCNECNLGKSDKVVEQLELIQR